jgi:hypothetical protein
MLSMGSFAEAKPFSIETKALDKIQNKAPSDKGTVKVRQTGETVVLHEVEILLNGMECLKSIDEDMENNFKEGFYVCSVRNQKVPDAEGAIHVSSRYNPYPQKLYEDLGCSTGVRLIDHFGYEITFHLYSNKARKDYKGTILDCITRGISEEVYGKGNRVRGLYFIRGTSKISNSELIKTHRLKF